MRSYYKVGMVTPLPILCYHAIVADGQENLPPQWSARYAVSLPECRQQLDILAAGDWKVVGLQDITKRVPFRPSVAITVDDGESSDMIAAEELRKRGLPATFFITWSRLGYNSFLTRDQVLELDRQGFTIGSHGLNHVRFTALTAEEVHDQLVGSRERLECLLGKPVTALALPYGSYNSAILAAAIATGYCPIMTSDFSLALAGNCVLPRLSIGARTTLRDFKALLTGNRVSVARRRVINAFHSRFNRMLSI